MSSSSSSSNCPAFNCTSYPSLNSNPDISGIGVLIGFLASAYITFLLCVALYLSQPSEATNPLDRLVTTATHYLFSFFQLTRRTSPPSSPKWSKALESAIVSLGDQQVIAGLSVLISAYSQLHCGLSSFHWQLAAKLAWFSSVTHLATLACLRRYFHGRPAIRTWRLAAMALMAAFLATVILSEGYLSAGVSMPIEFPAQCLWHPDSEWEYDGVDLKDDGKASFGVIYVLISLIWLIGSYIVTCLLLFPRLLRPLERLLIEGLGSRVERVLNRWEEERAEREEEFGWWSVLKLNLIISVVTLVFSTVDFFGSMLWELTWLLGSLVYGTIRIFMLRESLMGQGLKEVIEQENVWGFGQVVAVILLVLPFITYFETVYELSYSTSSESTPPESKNYLPTASFPQDPPVQTLSLRHSFLQQRPAYYALLLLESTMLLVVTADFLYLFSYHFETQGFTVHLSNPAKSYVAWFGINAILLWIYTLVFLDAKAEDSWERWQCSKKRYMGLRWSILLGFASILIIGISVAQRYA